MVLSLHVFAEMTARSDGVRLWEGEKPGWLAGVESQMIRQVCWGSQRECRTGLSGPLYPTPNVL